MQKKNAAVVGKRTTARYAEGGRNLLFKHVYQLVTNVDQSQDHVKLCGSVYIPLFPFSIFNGKWKMENEQPFFIFNEK